MTASTHTYSGQHIATVILAVRYIGSVVPVEEEVDTLRPRTQALGTDLAAAILTQRFASPASSGTQQLCREITAFRAVKPMAGVLPFHHTAAEAIPDQVAAALASVVERSSQCSQQNLAPQAFIPHVIHQFAAIASSSSLASHTYSDAGTGHTEDQHVDLVMAMVFMGNVCGRFCRRGYASIVAETCWQLLQKQSQSVHHAPTDAPHHQHPHDDDDQQQQQQPQPESTAANSQQQQQQPQPDRSIGKESSWPTTAVNTQQQQQQEQQDQQPHMPEHMTPHPQETAAFSASSLQTSASSLSQQAACMIIHAVQEPTAVDKLLTCLLQCASSDLQQLDKAAALLHTVLQPMWVQDSVRYSARISHYS